jgi:hypothetical protein
VNSSAGVLYGQGSTVWGPEFKLPRPEEAQHAFVPLLGERAVGNEYVDVIEGLDFRGHAECSIDACRVGFVTPNV